MRTIAVPAIAAASILLAPQAIAQTNGAETATEETAGQTATTGGRFIGNSLNNVTAARLRADDFASQDGGTAPPLSYWAGGELHGFGGDGTGRQVEGVFGIDYFTNSDTLVGGFIGLGGANREVLSFDSEIDAQVVGGYYADSVGDSGVFNVFLGGGSADYTTDGATVSVPRAMAGLSISGEKEREKSVFVPSLKAVAVREEMPQFVGNSGVHPATTIDGVTVSATARWEMNANLGSSGLAPYVAVGLDLLYTDYGNGTTDRAVAPRVGAGLVGVVGDGLLAIDVDAGMVDSSTYDLGARATYSFGF